MKASQSTILPRSSRVARVKTSASTLRELTDVLFSRFPSFEWATFLRFGWTDTPRGLVLTLAGIDQPRTGELDESVGHVAIQEHYTLRVALSADEHPLAVGVAHSHPRGAFTYPSSVDDGMDSYLARYFGDFAPNRPYVSLILSERNGVVVASGRIWWGGEWLAMDRFIVDGAALRIDESFHVGEQKPQVAPVARRGRVARLASSFGEEAADRLAASTVAVVGVGGTGSPAIELLARAGVGRLILVDPDRFTESNLERVHGSEDADVAASPSKVSLARRHVLAINPDCVVEAIVGRLPQRAVLEAVVHADVVLGCTDQQHSRLALSDLAIRYQVAVLDCGVALEGKEGLITGQVTQLLRMLPGDPCALCREITSAQRVAQELMSDEERASRRAAAASAHRQGLDGDAYWRHEPQINTVGYLTTLAGSMAAGYAIGWLTARFQPPFRRLQFNLSALELGATDVDCRARPSCVCRRASGWSDQAVADALITAPAHWPEPVFI